MVNMKQFIKVFITIYFVISFSYVHATIVSRDDVRAFIDNMIIEHGFDADKLNFIFRQIKLSDHVLKAISQPAEALPWYKYRPIFLQNKRIQLGVDFWDKNKTNLSKAEDIYGVPAEIMVAIIGVETRYGKNKGKYKVINSLATLAFEYPKRGEFFKSELEQYLLLTREQGIDPHSIKGSYAGAMGIPQFISSSYRRYAVDFDQDGHIDIWSNAADAIGSIGNYFKVHGWRSGRFVAIPAEIDGKKYMKALNDKLKHELSTKDLKKFGIKTGANLSTYIKVKLLDLETVNGNEYWLGFDNFYVITRYNNSVLYAMAVYQLALEIRKKYIAEMAFKE